MKRAILALALSIVACGGGRAPGPAALQAGVPCTQCRMTVSDGRLAAQLVAPGEDPRFFDDIGCLAAYLRRASQDAPRGLEDARAFVADHETGEWLAAGAAVYSRAETIATPMGSHTIAHRDAAARARDPLAKGAAPLAARDVFGRDLPGGAGDAR